LDKSFYYPDDGDHSRILEEMARLFFLIAFFLSNGLSGQQILGNLSLLSQKSIKLEGFNGLKTYPISKTNIDDSGNFKLNFSKADYGIAYLIAGDDKPFLVILCAEDIEIIGEALSNTETIKIKRGQENKWFEQYAKEHPKRDQALSAWRYLENIYASDTLFADQHIPKKAIEQEKQRIEDEDAIFLSRLPRDSYVKWFLPVRRLVSDVSVVAQYRTDEIPTTIASFRNMNYTDPRLYKSGLFKDAIENHFWLLENSGRSLDSVFVEMKISINALIENLVQDEQKLNEVTDYLFNLLERRSLFSASEYLALKVLNEGSCTIDDDLAIQLESYRAMKKGVVAPDIHFKAENTILGNPEKTLPKTMFEIESKYTLVVFGASWCPKCVQELIELNKLYTKWKSKGIEVVFVSLDENKETYFNFVKPFSFISTCDFQKWESKMVKDYYVFGTPTMYLLNAKHEILLKPISVSHVDTWVDYKMSETKE